ncbi:hypothetical protein FACS189465_0650 [Clostridia bacterium]|nr:hypothetical protein FACS189465_0650 [Clostridia bacterium]
MDTLLHKLGEKVKGVIEGFDRIVFKGFLKPIAFGAGMQRLLQSHRVLNKDYKTWVMKQSESIIKNAEQYVQANCGTKIQYISSSNERKEALAHERQRQTGIKSGLIGAWSCVEPCSTYHSTFNANAKFPLLQQKFSRCKHLYSYFDDPVFEFMSIRLQTWAPYGIQIAMNGCEWLRRSLDKVGSSYFVNGNKFLDIDNYELAQSLLNAQVKTNWVSELSKFLPKIFPSMKDIVGDAMTYTWTLW